MTTDSTDKSSSSSSESTILMRLEKAVQNLLTMGYEPKFLFLTFADKALMVYELVKMADLLGLKNNAALLPQLILKDASDKELMTIPPRWVFMGMSVITCEYLACSFISSEDFETTSIGVGARAKV